MAILGIDQRRSSGQSRQFKVSGPCRQSSPSSGGKCGTREQYQSLSLPPPRNHIHRTKVRCRDRRPRMTGLIVWTCTCCGPPL
jgi:hypothetical protein